MRPQREALFHELLKGGWIREDSHYGQRFLRGRKHEVRKLSIEFSKNKIHGDHM